jgi:hypothetical protein
LEDHFIAHNADDFVGNHFMLGECCAGYGEQAPGENDVLKHTAQK